MGNECPNVESHEPENIHVIFYNRFVCMLYCDELVTYRSCRHRRHPLNMAQNVTVRPQEL